MFENMEQKHLVDEKVFLQLEKWLKFNPKITDEFGQKGKIEHLTTDNYDMIFHLVCPDLGCCANWYSPHIDSYCPMHTIPYLGRCFGLVKIENDKMIYVAAVQNAPVLPVEIYKYVWPNEIPKHWKIYDVYWMDSNDRRELGRMIVKCDITDKDLNSRIIAQYFKDGTDVEIDGDDQIMYYSCSMSNCDDCEDKTDECEDSCENSSYDETVEFVLIKEPSLDDLHFRTVLGTDEVFVIE